MPKQAASNLSTLSMNLHAGHSQSLRSYLIFLFLSEQGYNLNGTQDYSSQERAHCIYGSTPSKSGARLV